jgi:hypothetical protein
LLSILILVGIAASAAEGVSVETLLTDLDRPCGIVTRLGGTAVRYELFIAESGAGRVVQWSNLLPNEVTPTVTGFSTNAAETALDQTGPLALWFIDPLRLVVAASMDDNQRCVHVFDLPEDNAPLGVVDAIDHPAGPPPIASNAGPFACYSLTRSRSNDFVPDMLVMAIRTASGPAALYKSRVQAGEVGTLQPFAAGAFAGATTSRLAVATSNRGRIVVARSAASAEASAGRLTFLNPIDGSVDMEMPLDLPEVVGLAYSPITERLYAADFAGGIHRIDNASEPGRPASHVVRIADVPRPTALAFAPDGSLYVTTFGTADTSGTLQVLTGDL